MILMFRVLPLFFLLLLSACSKEPLYQEEGFVFGTRVEVSVYGVEEKHASAAVATVMQEFQRLHNMLHAWKPSELSSLNAAIAEGKTFAVTPELAALLHDATQISAQSGGLFNPAIGGLVKLWGFQADEYKPEIPPALQVEALAAKLPQMRELTYTEKGDATLVGSYNRAVQLDLGGYAKGYALDRAVMLLKKQGIQNALINIGGNIIAMGKHGSRDWRVGIQHPRQAGPIATLDLHDGEAIGTSGDYQRYFELNGKRYCHLIDPRSGLPAQGVQAVTVLTHGERAGVLSDATTKPVFIVGKAAWTEVAQKMQQDNMMLIDADGVVHLTTALQKRLEFTDKNAIRKVMQ